MPKQPNIIRLRFTCPAGHEFTKTMDTSDPSPDPHFCYRCRASWAKREVL